MTESELANIILVIREQVGFLWNVYITACLFLIGWVFSSKSLWDQTKRKVIMILFGAFALINLSAIYSEYRLLSDAAEQLRFIATQDSRFLQRLSEDTGLGGFLASVLHISADLFVLYLITLRAKGTERAELTLAAEAHSSRCKLFIEIRLSHPCLQLNSDCLLTLQFLLLIKVHKLDHLQSPMRPLWTAIQ